jgi:hypothetical protein
VYCVFIEKSCTLQEAIDYVAGMVQTRIEEFQVFKKALPSFGLKDLMKYLEGIEHWISGTMHWYYKTNRAHSSSFCSWLFLTSLFDRLLHYQPSERWADS